MDQDGFNKPRNRRSPEEETHKKDKAKDFVSAMLCENWKQQELVKKDGRMSILTSIMLVSQLAASIGMATFAVQEVSPL